MPHTRYGVVDIGSNSVLLEVVEFRGKAIHTITTERTVTRLGSGVGNENRLDSRALLDTIETINQFVEMALHLGVSDANLRLIATAAVRQADNRNELLKAVSKPLNRTIEVITPEQEARYALQGVSHRFPIANRDIAVIDIGGGSTEITLTTDGNITHSTSLPIGAVTLSSQFDLHDVIDPAPYKRMMQCISDMLDTHVSKILPIDTVYATGGSCSALAAMELHQDESALFESNSLDGYVLQLESINHQLDLLIELDANGRSKVGGITSERAEIIVAGAAIARLVLEKLCTDSMTIHTGGIKLGVLLEMIDSI